MKMARELLRHLGGRAGSADDLVFEALDLALPLEGAKSWRGVAFFPQSQSWPGKLSSLVTNHKGRSLVFVSASRIMDDYSSRPACVVKCGRHFYLLTRDHEQEEWLNTSAITCHWDGFNLTLLEAPSVAESGS